MQTCHTKEGFIVVPFNYIDSCLIGNILSAPRSARLIRSRLFEMKTGILTEEGLIVGFRATHHPYVAKKLP